MNSDSSRRPAARRPRRDGLLLFIFFTHVALLAACGPPPPAQGGQRYELRGKVVSVDKEQGQLTVEHEAVPGLMDGMTMPFTLKDRDALEVAAAGDRIQATLVVTDRESWLENPVITKGGGTEAPDNAADPTLPQAGAEVPDFSLVNQDGRPVRLRQYRGRALLLTFVYTRCPLPDYCTRMSNNFAEVNRELAKDPKLYAATHLLSVTLDPAHDTPKVLRSYGAAHTENYADEKFDHWEFLTGQPDEIRRMATFFGLTYFEEGDQITHTLSTAVVAPDGRVYRVYRGNRWKPDEALRDLQAAVGQRQG